MNLVAELQKLESMYRSGALSHAEFTQAKAALLANPAPTPAASSTADPMKLMARQNELAQIDREWEIEKEQYVVYDRWGRAMVPNQMGSTMYRFAGNTSRGAGVVVLIFGTLWTIFAFWLTSDAPFPLVKFIFPAFGIMFVLFGLFGTLRMGTMLDSMREQYEQKAQAYQDGYARYQQKRQDAINRHRAEDGVI
jgi:hypothetical protein